MLYYMSISVRIISLFHLASLTGSWQVVLAFMLLVLLITGFAADTQRDEKDSFIKTFAQKRQ